MSFVCPMALMTQENTRTPALRVRSVVVSCPSTREADHEVGLVVDERLEHDRDLGGVVLTVGVERDDELGAELDAQRVPDAQRDSRDPGSR